jgi:hypothetical protein
LLARNGADLSHRNDDGEARKQVATGERHPAFRTEQTNTQDGGICADCASPGYQTPARSGNRLYHTFSWLLGRKNPIATPALLSG